MLDHVGCEGTTIEGAGQYKGGSRGARQRPATRGQSLLPGLLGLVKPLAGVELGYFGDTFGRPSAGKLPWAESGPNSDMFCDAAHPYRDRAERAAQEAAGGSPRWLDPPST